LLLQFKILLLVVAATAPGAAWMCNFRCGLHGLHCYFVSLVEVGIVIMTIERWLEHMTANWYVLAAVR